MMKEFNKYIEYSDDDFLSPTEKYIVSIINENVDLFVNCKSINEFCRDMGFVAASLTMLAKKLNYKSAKDMKNKIRVEYFKREISANMLTIDNMYQNEKIPTFYKELLNNFIYDFILKTKKIDWEQIDELVNRLSKCKTIYYLSSTEFNESDLETFCYVTNKKFISIKSDLRIQILDSIIDVNDSVFLVSKVRDYLKDSEKSLIQKFVDKKIPCYLFMPNRNLGVDKTCKIFSFGAIESESKNDFEKLWDYKSFHDRIFSIIMYIVIKKNKMDYIKF